MGVTAEQLMSAEVPFAVKAGGVALSFVAMPDHLRRGLAGCVVSWRITDDGAPWPVTGANVERLPEGLRAAIVRRLSKAYSDSADMGDEGEEMSITLTELLENYRDTVVINVALGKPGGVVEREAVTLTHKPIDDEVWQAVTAIKAEGDTPAGALQLAYLDARIEDLTDDGKPVESFPADFWAGLKPGLRAQIVEGVVRNVPAAILFASREAEGKTDAVNGEE